MKGKMVNVVKDANMGELLKDLIIKELDLGYDRRQNILLSCTIDGCNRISYCSCDCNDSSW